MAKKEEKKTEKIGKVEDKSVSSVVKDIERNMFSVKFYPVAVDEETKDEAVKFIKKTYAEGNETVRQLLLYMIHENISEFFEFRIAHTFDFMKSKHPDVEPARIRMNVYKKMFNYNTSIEGIMELISILSSLREGDDSAKLLTYHYARACAWESESSVLLRNAIIEALGESESPYALNALLHYAKNTDNERTFNRLLSALEKWDKKLATAKIPDSKKKKFGGMLKNILASKFRGRHYG